MPGGGPPGTGGGIGTYLSSPVAHLRKLSTVVTSANERRFVCFSEEKVRNAHATIPQDAHLTDRRKTLKTDIFLF